MVNNSILTIKNLPKKFGILVLCSGIYPEKIGGSEIHIFYTCSRLAEKGYRVFVISPASTFSKIALNEKISFVKISLKLWPTPLRTLSYIIKSFIVSFKFRKHFDLLHAHAADYPMITAFLFSSFYHKPYIVTCHGSDIRIFGSKFLHRIFQYPFLHNAKKIIAVSSEIAELLTRKYDIPRHKIVIIRNGYDERIIQDFTNIRLCVSSEESKRIICVANMRPEKDHMTLLKGFARVNKTIDKVQLLLIGDGPLREQLEKFCVQHGLYNTKFLGRLPHRIVLEQIAKSDIFILTSKEEGLPNVIIEALALGKPVVATAVGGIPEMIKDDVNGILIPPKSPECVAEALRRLLIDPDLSRKLGRTASESVKGYSWSRIAENYEAIYKKTLKIRMEFF
jgi:glycosyltransferase involved in cell wall biosynthesis